MTKLAVILSLKATTSSTDSFALALAVVTYYEASQEYRTTVSHVIVT